MLQPGTVLLGKYRIERILGQGGMGVVALAHHLQLDQPVAIKFLRPEVLDKQTVVARFLREAQAAVKLKSEHVCKVHDVGTLESGSPYMVMEFMDGAELGDLARERRLAPGEVVELVLQACEALAEAHALGIVHRDIKPTNLFVTRRPDGSALLKVLDFGISKAPATMDTELTSTQAVMGTPAYMSPEQMRASKHVDPRSDVWALGVVLYELINGRRPFPGRAYSELCLQVGMDPTPAMNAAVPPGLEAAVARCLEKDPGKRFHNVAELAAALAPYAHDSQRARMSVERIGRVLGVTVPAQSGPAAPGAMAAVHGGAQAIDWTAGGPPSTLSASMGQVDVEATAPGRRWMVAGAAGATLAAAVIVVMLLGGMGGSEPDGVSGDGGATAGAATGEPADEPSVVQPANAEMIIDAGVDAMAAAMAASENAAAAGEDGSKEAAGNDGSEEAAGNDDSGAQEKTAKRTTAKASSRKSSKRSSRKTRDKERTPARTDRPASGKAGSHDDVFGTRQ